MANDKITMLYVWYVDVKKLNDTHGKTVKQKKCTIMLKEHN